MLQAIILCSFFLPHCVFEFPLPRAVWLQALVHLVVSWGKPPGEALPSPVKPCVQVQSSAVF